MRKLIFVFSVMLVMAAGSVNAQSAKGADYFEGKWMVLFKDIPQGDTRLLFDFQKKDTSLTGTILDSAGTVVVAEMSRVDVADNTVTVYFFAEGHDVYMTLTKLDEDHVKGRIVDMFDAEGDRVKELPGK